MSNISVGVFASTASLRHRNRKALTRKGQTSPQKCSSTIILFSAINFCHWVGIFVVCIAAGIICIVDAASGVCIE
jgi:hypothetical protein